MAHRPRIRWIVNAALGTLLAWGTVLSLAVGLTGYYDLFRKRDPEAYYAIEDRFFPLQRLLLRLGPPYGELQMSVRFPPAAAGDEVLFSLGAWADADLLCLRYREDGRVIFRFRHAGQWTRSPAIPVTPGRTYRLDVVSGALLPPINERALRRHFPDRPDPRHRLGITLDGDEILGGTFDFQPLDPRYVTFERSHAGGEDCLGTFSGQILEVRHGGRLR
jgi:hypothetical protein